MMVNQKTVLLCFVLLIVCHSRKPLNILVYSPVFGRSHSNFMGNIADALSEAGHNVTFLVPVADPSRRHDVGQRLTENVIIVEKGRTSQADSQNVDMDEVLKPLWLTRNTPADFETCFAFFLEMMRSTCEEFVSNEHVFAVLSATQFDVAIAEPVSVCGLGYFDALGIQKTILASSTTHYEGVVRNAGEPVDMSYVPVHGAYFDEKMDIVQRYTNWAAAHVMAGNLEKMFDEEMKSYRSFLGANVAHWRDLIPAASLMFTNSNPYLDFPRPVLQKTVAIGGISVNMEEIKSAQLPENVSALLDERQYNMLISFGSMVKSSTMPEQWRDSIFAVTQQFPNVTFIWKYESDDLEWAAAAENIHFLKWMPQAALLNEKRVNAFLTHGGLASTNELAYLGKPAIMVPVFGDQGRNAPMLARHGAALVLHKYDLEKTTVVANMIQKIIFDRSYSQKAVELAALLNAAPFKPKELVVKHTEFVATFGPLPLMDPYIRQLNWFQRTFTDIFILMFVFYSTILIIPVLALRKLCRFVAFWAQGLIEKEKFPDPLILEPISAIVHEEFISILVKASGFMFEPNDELIIDFMKQADGSFKFSRGSILTCRYDSTAELYK